jgi:hypothetical protein
MINIKNGGTGEDSPLHHPLMRRVCGEVGGSKLKNCNSFPEPNSEPGQKLLDYVAP